jgi:hypothetical protein
MCFQIFVPLFAVLVCYASSANDRNSSSLTENLTQSVQKAEFLKANIHEFLGWFAKSPKGTISYVLFIRPSVRKEQLGSHWTDFHEI